VGRLPPLDCNADGRANAGICRNPDRLLAGLPLNRLNGFDLDPCVDERPELCIEADFSPDGNPASHRVLMIRIEIAARRLDSPIADVTPRRLHIEDNDYLD
jgi:hypothetical protein